MPCFNTCFIRGYKIARLASLSLIRKPLKEKLQPFIDSMSSRIRSCQKVCEAVTFLLDNIYIRFGSKLYRQIVGIPMATNCAPLVADLFLFCYERDFMLSLSEDN